MHLLLEDSNDEFSPLIRPDIVFSNSNILKGILVNEYNKDKKFSNFTEKYSCCKCNQIVYNKEPLECQKGHFACKKCFEDHLSTNNTTNKDTTNNKCIVNGCSVVVNSMNDLHKNKFFRDSLSNKKIRCPYKYKYQLYQDDNTQDYIDQNQIESIYKDQNGCGDEIKVGQLESHLKSCKSRFVKCSNSGCDEVVRFKDSNSHIGKCRYTIISCPYCGVNLKRYELNSHNDVCPSIEIQCNQCSNMVKRGDMDDHIESICLDTVLSCDYSDYGCLETFKRRDLEHHYETINHSIFMTKLNQQLLEQLIDSRNEIDRLNNQVEELTELAKNEISKFNTVVNGYLLNKLHQLENNNTSYRSTWVISNFTGGDSNINSDTIKFNNKEFYLNIYKSNVLSSTLNIFLYGNELYDGEYHFQVKIYNNHTNKYIKAYNLGSFILDADGGFHCGSCKINQELTINNGFINDDGSLKIKFKIIDDKKSKLSNSLKSII